MLRRPFRIGYAVAYHDKLNRRSVLPDLTTKPSSTAMAKQLTWFPFLIEWGASLLLSWLCTFCGSMLLSRVTCINRCASNWCPRNTAVCKIPRTSRPNLSKCPPWLTEPYWWKQEAPWGNSSYTVYSNTWRSKHRKNEEHCYAVASLIILLSYSHVARI